ncbi:MAG: Uma2 family endonuclease [Synechococcaceae cyanobacterium SM2_3_1]|nr:Uma2 family endonuclease [Synechococcaceae cyanobacterium SM2_3_1]
MAKVLIRAAEKRVTLSGLSWDAYAQVRQALGSSRSARLTYDQGRLEITMPLEEHETAAEWIALLIRHWVRATGRKLKTLGSTTLERPDLNRGAEPDKAFYIQNYDKVAGKMVDLQRDPPPDLVLEVDITHTDLDKDQLYASLGIPEFWRFDGERIRFLVLKGGKYQEFAYSPTFPVLQKEDIYQFLQACFVDEIEAEQQIVGSIQLQLERDA